MKNPKKIIHCLQNIRLSDEERASGRKRLLNFMASYPYQREEKPTLWSRFFGTHFFLRAPATVALSLVILLTFSGSISYAAESSLPGDLLYPIKTEINEKVVGIFKWNSEAKAEWELWQMQRRLGEAEMLAEKGELNVETRVELEEKVNFKVERMEEHLEILEAEGNAETAEALKTRYEQMRQNHEGKLMHLNLPLEVRIQMRENFIEQMEVELESENSEFPDYKKLSPPSEELQPEALPPPPEEPPVSPRPPFWRLLDFLE